MEESRLTIELLGKKKLKDDIEMLCRLEREIFGADGYPRYFFRQSTEMFGDTFLVCRDEKGKIAGYLLGAVKRGREEGWLLSMCVEEKLRRKGVGSALLEMMCGIMKGMSVREIFVTVEPKNHAAINAYSKSGFSIQKMQQDYHGRGYHRYLMKKTLAYS